MKHSFGKQPIITEILRITAGIQRTRRTGSIKPAFCSLKSEPSPTSPLHRNPRSAKDEPGKPIHHLIHLQGLSFRQPQSLTSADQLKQQIAFFIPHRFPDDLCFHRRFIRTQSANETLTASLLSSSHSCFLHPSVAHTWTLWPVVSHFGSVWLHIRHLFKLPSYLSSLGGNF